MNTNRQLIEQFLQFINTGDATIGKPIISDDVIFYAPTSPEPMKGFEGYMGVLAMMRGAMPDIQWKIEETISEGDKILVRYTMTGTQTQPLMGMPATGKKICVTAMNIYEFKDGKLRGKPFYSESAQYTMLWGGLFTKEECPGLIDAAVYELGPAPRRKPPKLDIGAANMFIGLCIRLDMLSRLGYVDVMLEEIKYLCGIMLKKGPGTLWETVSGQSSRCHGFMSHIGVLLSRDVLGLDIPEAFPEKRVRVAPRPGALSSASGSVNTPDGLISVSWSNNGRGFELRVNAPRSYRVDLILPEEVRGHSSVTVNGEPVTGREFEFHGIKAPLTVKTQK